MEELHKRDIMFVREHDSNKMLRHSGNLLQEMSTVLKTVYKRTGDLRLMRAQLCVEELSEILMALASRDEVSLLDGIADLLYVVIGTGVSYGLPVAEAFAEVHRSNMTKEMRNDDHAHGRKGKGDGYSAPDLASVLQSSRRLSY